MLRKITTILLSAGLLVACASPMPDAKSIVVANEGKTSMVDFREVEEFPGSVTCGTYQVTSKWGESDGYQDFLVIGEQLRRRPNAEEKAIYCSDNPRQAFENIFGIIPSDKSNPGLAKFRKDLKVLETALISYKADTGKFPSVDKGLTALQENTESGDSESPKDRYLNPVPSDLWGYPYVYEPSRWGGVKLAFTISTLGADGSKGGTGENADISSKLIPYLEHLDSL